MKRHLFLILMLLAAAQARAQPPAPAVDLPTVLRFASQASLPVSVEAANMAAAEAEGRQARALPNPTLGYNRQRQPGRLTNFDSTRAQQWSIEQPLLLGGQRGARMRAASRAVEVAAARVALTRHGAAADAASAHVGLLLAQERLATLQAGLDELARLRRVVEGRRAAGLASEYEALRVDVEESGWRGRVADAAAEVLERQAVLALTLGLSDWRPTAIGELSPLAPLAPSHAAGGAPPDVMLARREQDAAAAQVDVARRERMPAVSLTAERFWTSRPYGGTTSIGFALEVPLFDRRNGALDKARAQAAGASLERELAEARSAADIDGQARLVAQRTLALDDFRRRSASRSPVLKRMAEDSYRAGKTSIAELLDAARSSVELTLAEQELIAVLMEAQLKLESARGELLERAR